MQANLNSPSTLIAAALIALSCAACGGSEEASSQSLDLQGISRAQLQALLETMDNAGATQAAPAVDQQERMLAKMAKLMERLEELEGDDEDWWSEADFGGGDELTAEQIESFLALAGSQSVTGMSYGQGVDYGRDLEAAMVMYMQLAQQAQALGYGGGGYGGGYGNSNDNFWSSNVGMGNSSADGSSGYVHIPSTTGGSGTTVSY